MKFYVVVDTNVFVSALYTNHKDSSTVKVIEKLYDGDIIPLYSDDTMSEYKEVLNRPLLNLSRNEIGKIINAIKEYGIKITPDTIEIDLPDKDDIMFYQLVMDKKTVNNKFLITGNIKHFPKSPIIVRPEEFLEIYNRKK